jgi:hypothetical protein
VTQIYATTATATARDRRKFFYRSIHVIKSKKVLKSENKQKKFSFFPSLNQYFPHIPYVASKKSQKNH